MSYGWFDIMIHVLLIPIYQIISTLRHEGAHALTAKAYGFPITVFKILPHRHDGHFYWGRVSWLPTNRDRWLIYMMPYIVNVVSLAAGTAMIRFIDWSSFHLYTLTAIMLVLSPAIDTIYNFCKYLFFGRGDFARVLHGEGSGC